MSFLIHLYTCLSLMHFFCVQVHVISLKVKISTFDKMFLMEHTLRSKGKMCLKAKLVNGFKMVRNKFFPNSTLLFYTGKASVKTKAKLFLNLSNFQNLECFGYNKEWLWFGHPKYRKFSIHHKKQIFTKNPWGSTLDGNLLLQILKLKRETPGLKQLFITKRVLNFHWFDECFILWNKDFSILVEIQHFFGLTQPTNGFQNFW